MFDWKKKKDSLKEKSHLNAKIYTHHFNTHTKQINLSFQSSNSVGYSSNIVFVPFLFTHTSLDKDKTRSVLRAISTVTSQMWCVLTVFYRKAAIFFFFLLLSIQLWRARIEADTEWSTWRRFSLSLSNSYSSLCRWDICIYFVYQKALNQMNERMRYVDRG